MRDGRVENQRAYSGVCSGEGQGEPTAKPGPLRPWAGGEDGVAPLESELQGKLNRLCPATPQRESVRIWRTWYGFEHVAFYPPNPHP